MSTGIPALLESWCEWGPRHVFVPHPLHENEAISVRIPTQVPGALTSSSPARACTAAARSDSPTKAASARAADSYSYAGESHAAADDSYVEAVVPSLHSMKPPRFG